MCVHKTLLLLLRLFQRSGLEFSIILSLFFLSSTIVFKAAGFFFGHTLTVNESSTWVDG